MTSPMQIEVQDHSEGLAKTVERIEKSILTLRAMPDREHGWIYGRNNGWPEYALQYSEGIVRKFKPTTKDVQHYLTALGWLTWLGRQNGGKRDVRIIVSRAYGQPWYKIAERVGRDRRTVKRWHDGAITTIYSRFCDEINEM